MMSRTYQGPGGGCEFRIKIPSTSMGDMALLMPCSLQLLLRSMDDVRMSRGAFERERVIVALLVMRRQIGHRVRADRLEGGVDRGTFVEPVVVAYSRPGGSESSIQHTPLRIFCMELIENQGC